MDQNDDKRKAMQYFCIEEIRRKMMTFMVTYNTKNEEVIGIAHQHLHVVLYLRRSSLVP
jgi:proteasome lid subunit RPN8/RPN11